MGTWMRVCKTNDITEEQLFPVDCNDSKLMLVRAGSTIYAANRTCTHADADLSTGFIAPGAGAKNCPGVRCPLHLSVFDLNTGIPLNPPAEGPLCTYKVKVDGDDVYVEV